MRTRDDARRGRSRQFVENVRRFPCLSSPSRETRVVYRACETVIPTACLRPARGPGALGGDEEDGSGPALPRSTSGREKPPGVTPTLSFPVAQTLHAAQ